MYLSKKRWHQRAIAEALEVTESAVSHWLSTARRQGPHALQAHPHPGRPGRLTPEQKELIPEFLGHGAEAYGFRGEVWTCPRIAGVLQQEFGVSYSRSQVSRLLKELHWTPQVPLIRAIQRNEAAIRQWREGIWPELRNRAKRERRTLVFVDESGFYLLPGVVKTYAPQGETPRLDEWLTRDHLSIMGAVTTDGKIYSLVRQEPLTGLHTMAFLNHLRRSAGKSLLVIWDGSPIHRRAEVQEFLTETGSGKIQVEPLPPYAPDLNPVEWMWKHLKKVELGNRACLDLEELHLEFHLAFGRIRQKPRLVLSFFEGAGLPM